MVLFVSVTLESNSRDTELNMIGESIGSDLAIRNFSIGFISSSCALIRMNLSEYPFNPSMNVGFGNLRSPYMRGYLLLIESLSSVDISYISLDGLIFFSLHVSMKCFR